ncbi:hypothetical protein S40285_02935 [Stachybotrys chlorohalonatus IBT 40285]|uniref:type I protein arginine methyltransferase n=1 Tax=Stachybotrys chlorohalonatus (strain IBT 40285) TaxID=1283841 RepID=A0A084QK67_STAC4|nr:hypothetical protein S40285_02935 [Stachybotrys chlorohalonata IBT 40285]
MFSISTAPAKQSVADTITVLSGRLSSATLLEDRRAAILGLRSFAKDYPASVSSGALRSLIGSLANDGEDVDTVKVVLETLLMLFSPNENSPEASDEIALWLADEFTQRQENITLLLDFLETADFYSRLYSLQLLSAILSARTERTEECVFTAPLGISRLVAVLDDQREAIRNEGVSLLTYLTPTSTEIQKLVAFENAFERVFGIVEADGGLAEGGRAVEDCFILLANLLRHNTSNQSLFRESGCISKLADLLGRLLKAYDEETEISTWAQAQRNRNLYAFLAVARLFLTPGSVTTHQNQTAFWKHGLAYQVLQLAFDREAQVNIKAEALAACGDIIRDNASLQENFAQFMVPAPLENAPPTEKANGTAKVYVIDGLLDLTLNLQDLASFDVRFAACECLKAYLSNHTEVRQHFLGRAIEGHRSGRDETSNILTVLLRPSDDNVDPYRPWFAATIAFHLLYEHPAAKAQALALTEGDADHGEEVVTSIQTVAAHLTTGLRRDDDPRVTVGYLTLLLGWLFEDLDAVNDFLSEGSNVQSLILAALQPGSAGGEIVQGLCTMLLGVAYEFSTKDSPIPRASLHSIILSRLSRDTYLDRLSKLRSHPLIRDFEVTSQKLDPSLGQLPDVFFDTTFVNFFKDNYSRIVRAIDREPGLEIPILNGFQKGISRDLVDSLRGQVAEHAQEIQTLETRLAQEQAEHRKHSEEAAAELNKLRTSMEGLQRAHEAESRKRKDEANNELRELKMKMDGLRGSHDAALRKQREEAAAEVQQLKNALQGLERAHDAETRKLQSQHAVKISEHEKQLAQVRKSLEMETERIQRRTVAEAADLKATISRLEVDLMKMNKSKTQELQALREEHSKQSADLSATIKKLEGEAKKFEAQAAQAKRNTQELETQLEQAEKRRQELEAEVEKTHVAIDEERQKSKKAQTDLTEATKAKAATQSELDDLLMVFGDLEEKVAKYKARLKELGEEVSEGEDDEDDEDDSETAKTFSPSPRSPFHSQSRQAMSDLSTSSSSEGGEGEWLDVDSDSEPLTFASLFDPSLTFPSAGAMLAHTREAHGFDLHAVVRRLDLDFHGAVRLVNFLRRRAGEGQAVAERDVRAEDFAGDEFLKPALDNDALLFSLDEVLQGAEEGAEEADAALKRRNRELEEQLEALRNQFDSYRLVAQETLDRRWGDDAEPQGARAGAAPAPAKRTTHDYYFESYAQYDIHETMLKDSVRTDAYRDFIYGNKHLFKDKVVLDIGCGTGILSMFCAKAGASRVIAVDRSDIIVKAQENIFNNGLSSVITCVRGAIEDVVLPVAEVDVIVSEWMGYCLLYEAMLPSVLYARDRYLRKDTGIMAPSSATLWVAPLADPAFTADHIDFWRDVYGFDMKAMQEGIYEDVRIQTMPKAAVCGEPFPFRVLDLRTVKTQDLVFTAQWKSTLTRDVDRLDGFLIWFDNFFDTSPTDPLPDAHTTPETWAKKNPGSVAFSTGPFGTETHWKQGTLLVPADKSKDALASGTQIEGDITYAALKENERALTISGSWTVAGHEKQSCEWSLK